MTLPHLLGCLIGPALHFLDGLSDPPLARKRLDSHSPAIEFTCFFLAGDPRFATPDLDEHSLRCRGFSAVTR
jgi:hypothetical protein